MRVLMLCVAVILLLAVSADASRADYYDGLAKNPLLPLNPPLLADRASKALPFSAAFLVRVCQDKGQFVYRIDLDSDIRYGYKYNELRHAGTIYALSSYLSYISTEERSTAASKAVSDCIRRAVQWMDAIIDPVENEPGDMLAVWSKPKLMGTPDEKLAAKLGGTGLGLVAMLAADRHHEGIVPLDKLQRLGKFLLFMQDERTGGFISKYIPSKGGRDSAWESLYYPGEAALGLTMLYEKDHDGKWITSGKRALLYLANVRKGRVAVEPDHWALLATNALFRLREADDDVKLLISESEKIILFKHAIQVSLSISRELTTRARGTAAEDSFGGDGRTTPAATRLEGLQAVIELIRREPAWTAQHVKEHDVEVILDTIHRAMRFLLRSVVMEGPFSGAVPRAILASPPVKVDGNFERRASEIRIDYVQHAMSAWMAYDRLFGEGAEQPQPPATEEAAGQHTAQPTKGAEGHQEL